MLAEQDTSQARYSPGEILAERVSPSASISLSEYLPQRVSPSARRWWAGPVRWNRPGRESRVDDRAAEGDLQPAVRGERPAQGAAVGGAPRSVGARPELVGAVRAADGLVVGAGD